MSPPAREAWRRAQPNLRARRLVFLDETWASTNMARLYGRAPRGQRLVAAVLHGHWKTTTLIAAVRLEGITAPYVLDGPIDASPPPQASQSLNQKLPQTRISKKNLSTGDWL